MISLLAKSLLFGYDNIKAVSINGPATNPNNNTEKAMIFLPFLENYQVLKTNGVTDANISCLSNKLFSSFPLPDQTSSWTGDDIWAGQDLLTTPTTVNIDRTDGQVTAKSFLDDIVNAGTTNKDLLYIYMIGHGSTGTAPKDTYVRVATSAGASTWQGLPLDQGKIYHYHLNKALSMVDFKRCIILVDACNSGNIAEYLNRDQSLNTTNLSKVIALSAGTGSVTGLALGHYFVHLSRTGETIKNALDQANALNDSQDNSTIHYFGNQSDLQNFVTNFNLFEDNADLTAPVISNTLPANNTYSNDSLQTITANITDNLNDLNLDSLLLTLNGTDYRISNTELTFSNGLLTFTPSTKLNSGSYLVTVVAKDNDDNQASESWSFGIDTDGPSISNLQPSTTGLLNNNQPTISAIIKDGRGINNSSIELLLNSTLYTLASSELTLTDSNLILTPSTLPDTAYTVALSLRDTLNNLSQANWNFRIDATDPIIDITGPTNGSDISETSVLLQYLITEPNLSYVQVKLNDNPWSNATADSVLFSGLAQGISHTLIVRAVDDANNESIDSVIVNVLRDTTKPSISNLQPNVVGYLNDNTPIISAKVSDAKGIDSSSIELLLNSTPYNLTSPELTLIDSILSLNLTDSLPDGLYNINLSLRNLDSNETTENWSFNIDATKPALNIIDHFFRDSTYNTAVVRYSASDLNLNRVEVKIDDNDWATIPPDSFEVNGLENNQNYQVKIRAIDAANNETLDSTLIEVPIAIEKVDNKTYIYSLSNNPNPFNNITNIIYSIPKENKVKLDIYDAKGKLVKNLVNKNKDRGQYKTPFNAQGLPSGMYFYKLRTNDKQIVKRLLLLK